jgi:putative protease
MTSGESVSVEGDICQPAEKQAATEEGIKKLLCQTGDTCFTVRDCRVRLEGALFLPVGAVKRLRRLGLASLQDKLEQRGKRTHLKTRDNLKRKINSSDADASEAPSEKTSAASVYIASVLYPWQAELAIASDRIQEIYLRMEEMGREELGEWLKKGSEAGKKMYLMLPLIFRSAVYSGEKATLGEGSLYHRKELAGFVIHNLESYHFLTEEAGISPEKIITDANLYLTNREAVKFWQEQGVKRHTLPLELTGREMECLMNREGMEAILYGHIPLMVSAQCLCYNTRGCQKRNGQKKTIPVITDEKGRKFPVYTACRYCYNVIYHGDALSLGEEETLFVEGGVRRFRYDLTIETPEQAAGILKGVLPEGQKGHFYRGIH